MPGMMETVLNVGLCSKTIPGLIKKSGNERFVYDAYRRLIMMYSDVVMEKAEDIEPAEGKGIRKSARRDHWTSIKHVEGLQVRHRPDGRRPEAAVRRVQEEGQGSARAASSPTTRGAALGRRSAAVFKSWNGRRAVSYRKIEGIPDEWGTACNVQSMVFGNLGDTSATGVAFTRNPATGENKFYGEWLVNAQGEDVVAGIRTPNPLNEGTKNAQNQHLPSLQTEWPELYKQLDDIRSKLEQHYHDMQDIEFTIQEGKLYMLQCRNGKRTGTAALNMAMDMLAEGLIDETDGRDARRSRRSWTSCCTRSSIRRPRRRRRGVPVRPAGRARRRRAARSSSPRRTRWTGAKQGEKVILVREETNPEDVEGMRAAEGILTARGGMTSHAALVARGWGKCCIVGAGEHEDRPRRQDG